MAEPSCSNDIDVNFINEMIPHHEGAIAMAKTTLEYPICSELKTILQAIITSQSNGVRQLNDELPVQAKTYLNRLSEVAGVELGIVSVGPEREQTIVLKKLL